MAAHYKVKYGLQGLEKTLTLASKRFSRSIDSEDVPPSSLDKKLTSSLPNLVDNFDESNNSEDTGDDVPYMVMHKNIQQSMSLDKLSLGTTPFHKPLASSVSSGGSFNYSDSSSSDHGSHSIRVANGYLTSPTRPPGGYVNHPTIPENTDDFNGK